MQVPRVERQVGGHPQVRRRGAGGARGQCARHLAGRVQGHGQGVSPNQAVDFLIWKILKNI